jgi:hypothetical protein
LAEAVGWVNHGSAHQSACGLGGITSPRRRSAEIGVDQPAIGIVRIDRLLGRVFVAVFARIEPTRGRGCSRRRLDCAGRRVGIELLGSGVALFYGGPPPRLGVRRIFLPLALEFRIRVRVWLIQMAVRIDGVGIVCHFTSPNIPLPATFYESAPTDRRPGRDRIDPYPNIYA